MDKVFNILQTNKNFESIFLSAWAQKMWQLWQGSTPSQTWTKPALFSRLTIGVWPRILLICPMTRQKNFCYRWLALLEYQAQLNWNHLNRKQYPVLSILTGVVLTLTKAGKWGLLLLDWRTLSFAEKVIKNNHRTMSFKIVIKQFLIHTVLTNNFIHHRVVGQRQLYPFYVIRMLFCCL